MVCRKVGRASHWVSSPFEDNHREASSRISRTLSRSPCCALIILTSEAIPAKPLTLTLTLAFARFGYSQGTYNVGVLSWAVLGDSELCYRISTIMVRHRLSLAQPMVLATQPWKPRAKPRRKHGRDPREEPNPRQD